MLSIFVELTSTSRFWKVKPDRSDLGEVLPGPSGRRASWPSVGTEEVAGDYQKYSLCLIGQHLPLSLWPLAGLLPPAES